MATRLKRDEAAQRALAYGADPGAEVVRVEDLDGSAWAVTLRGELDLPRRGPVGVGRAGHKGCRGACITFDATDGERHEPLSVEAWDWIPAASSDSDGS